MHAEVYKLKALVSKAIPEGTDLDVVTETLVSLLACVLVYGAVDPQEAARIVGDGLLACVDDLMETEENKPH